MEFRRSSFTERRKYGYRSRGVESDAVTPAADAYKKQDQL